MHFPHFESDNKKYYNGQGNGHHQNIFLNNIIHLRKAQFLT